MTQSNKNDNNKNVSWKKKPTTTTYFTKYTFSRKQKTTMEL